MKRLVVVLIIVAISMLVVVAPASAAKALPYEFVSGEGTQMQPPDGTGLVVPLAVDGTVYLHASTFGAVNLNGKVAIYVAEGEDPMNPFPTAFPMTYFHWVWGWWNDDGTYTAEGRWVRPTLPPFTADLVVDGDTLTITIQTVGSAWGWDTWVLHAVLQ
jgi:hypothetical protein